MQSKPQNWYKKVSGNLYQLTELKRYYPRRDLRHWKMLSGNDYGFMTIRTDELDHVFIELTRGTQFNGVTGYFDLSSLMRAALFHDNLVEEGYSDKHKHPMLQTTRARKAADRVFRDIAKEDGSNLRARILFRVLRGYAKAKKLFKR